jgi:tRNA(Ile2) C34 agmatinyltransferase TiaS
MSLLNNKIATFSFLVGLVTFTLTPNTMGEVRLEGEVLRAYPDYFLLTHEEGLTLIEMDDIDSYAESINLIPGDKVVVKGGRDSSSLNQESVEAQSVLVKELNTLYLLDPFDEEGAADFFPSIKEADSNASFNLEAKGIVTNVKGSLVTLKTPEGESFKVNLASLGCCKTNNKEMVKVKTGDEISVAGRLKNNLFGSDVIEASNLLIYKY